MGITLGQRKRSMPIEPSTQAESPMNTQESLRTLPGGAVGLEKYQAVDLAPASQASIGKPPQPLVPQFKVPKPVPVAKTTAVQSSDKAAAPKSAPKELRLKRKDSITQAEKKNESKSSSPEKPIDDARPSPILLEDTPMDDQDAEERNQQTSAGNYDLLNTPEVLRDSFRDDLNDATEGNTVEKTIEEVITLLFSSNFTITAVRHMSVSYSTSIVRLCMNTSLVVLKKW